MKKKILLPTDFSENSINAIKYALDMYKHDVCQFYVLNAISMPNHSIDTINMLQFDKNSFEKKKEEIEQKLTTLLEDIIQEKNHVANHIFETISSFDEPLEAIKKAIEDYDIGIVLMGTKGETESQSIVYGSLAIQVMEKSRNCPVLVVPVSANYNELNEIVFATSYKTHFKKSYLSYLSDLAEKSSASIRVLHIADEDKLSKEQHRQKNMLNEYFEGVVHTFHSMKNVDKEKAIDHFIKERGCDLIAFINKKHSFFDSLFRRPLVKTISYQTEVPILVMHDLRN